MNNGYRIKIQLIEIDRAAFYQYTDKCVQAIIESGKLSSLPNIVTSQKPWINQSDWFLSQDGAGREACQKS